MDAHDEKMWVHAVRRHGCMRQEGVDACYEKAGMYATKRRGCVQRKGGDARDEKAGMHTRRGMDVCDEEQIHSASMNKY